MSPGTMLHVLHMIFMFFAVFKNLKSSFLENNMPVHVLGGAQWLSGRVLDSRPKGRGFEPHRRHCVVSLSKNINPSLVLVQPRKTRPFITERLLMGRKESNQTKHVLGIFIENTTKMVWIIPLNTKNEDQTFRYRQNFAFSYTMQWKLLGSVKEWV